METKYNVGDKVLVPFKVTEITVRSDQIVYSLHSIDQSGLIYREEAEIHGKCESSELLQS